MYFNYWPMNFLIGGREVKQINVHNSNRPTDRPPNQQRTNMKGHRVVTLQISKEINIRTPRSLSLCSCVCLRILMHQRMGQSTQFLKFDLRPHYNVFLSNIQGYPFIYLSISQFIKLISLYLSCVNHDDIVKLFRQVIF